MTRLVIGVLLLPGGATIGTAATLVHDTVWGLPLAIISVIVTVRALPAGGPRVGFALGWSAAVGAFTVPRPSGDYLVAGGVTGYLLLLTALVSVVAALATVPPRSRDGSPERSPARSSSDSPADAESQESFPTMAP
ncbi:hypothetical protein GCM10027020_15850 [Nocardioides salsibiostraticola]